MASWKSWVTCGSGSPFSPPWGASLPPAFLSSAHVPGLCPAGSLGLAVCSETHAAVSSRPVPFRGQEEPQDECILVHSLTCSSLGVGVSSVRGSMETAAVNVCPVCVHFSRLLGGRATMEALTAESHVQGSRASPKSMGTHSGEGGLERGAGEHQGVSSC